MCCILTCAISDKKMLISDNWKRFFDSSFVIFKSLLFASYHADQCKQKQLYNKISGNVID